MLYGLKIKTFNIGKSDQKVQNQTKKPPKFVIEAEYISKIN